MSDGRATPHRVPERCANTIHSTHVSDHRCRRDKDHDGDCTFGDGRVDWLSSEEMRKELELDE
jgi:hypothetical protein